MQALVKSVSGASREGRVYSRPKVYSASNELIPVISCQRNDFKGEFGINTK